MNDNDDFSKIVKSNYGNIKKKDELKDYITLNGQIDCTCYIQKSKNMKKLYDFVEQKQNLLLKLNQALKDVIQEYHNLDLKMNLLSSAFNDLSNMYKNNEEDIDCFDKFYHFCNKLSYLYSQEKNLLRIDVKEYFKYSYREFEELKILFKDFNKAKNDYEDFQNKKFLNYGGQNKENDRDSYEKSKTSKKRLYRFLENRINDEYQRIAKIQRIRFQNTFGILGENIINLYQKENENLMKLVNNWKG